MPVAIAAAASGALIDSLKLSGAQIIFMG